MDACTESKLKTGFRKFGFTNQRTAKGNHCSCFDQSHLICTITALELTSLTGIAFVSLAFPNAKFPKYHAGASLVTMTTFLRFL